MEAVERRTQWGEDRRVTRCTVKAGGMATQALCASLYAGAGCRVCSVNPTQPAVPFDQLVGTLAPLLRAGGRWHRHTPQPGSFPCPGKERIGVMTDTIPVCSRFRGLDRFAVDERERMLYGGSRPAEA